MTRGIYRFSFKFLSAFVGIILLGSLPGLFNGLSINPAGYIESVKGMFGTLFTIGELKYRAGQEEYFLFPHILEPLQYSLIVLLGALLLAFILGLFFTFITMMLPRKGKKGFKLFAFLFESLPDVFIIALAQIGIIWFYKKTDILLLDVAAYDKTYALPILILAILPTVFFYRIMLLVFEEEMQKQYIDLAKTKGLNRQVILMVHVFRNTLIGIFYHSKSIIWFTLSNLFILEYVFNLRGIVMFIFEHPTPEIFTISFILLFIPLFILLALWQLLAEKVSKEEAIV
ncbi:ABC transporter permease subunit [Pseudalkalibacillus caeni]|uniref:ABC transporter permease subunit n=1 Tax=Exobacillus caeni TaxID=2574798 RepID=A0A5R9F3B9_9BACL|nr:ABC transporter permease subunit [Pseudalkalibacillus caeni]TLS38182.1 ABC transporter permease subunit [Pseudalkalibacillus caeni]